MNLRMHLERTYIRLHKRRCRESGSSHTRFTAVIGHKFLKRIGFTSVRFNALHNTFTADGAIIRNIVIHTAVLFTTIYPTIMHITTFKDIYNIIKKANAGFVVSSEEDFFNIADKMFSDDKFYQETVNNCERVFKSQQGALEFVINVCKETR